MVRCRSTPESRRTCCAPLNASCWTTEPQPDLLGYPDETALAAAIRAGDLDGRAAEVLPCLRTLVRHRLAVAHPGYDEAT